jgi:hypothetical protein
MRCFPPWRKSAKISLRPLANRSLCVFYIVSCHSCGFVSLEAANIIAGAAGAQRKVEKRMRARVQEENLVSPTEQKESRHVSAFLYSAHPKGEIYFAGKCFKNNKNELEREKLRAGIVYDEEFSMVRGTDGTQKFF